MDKIPLIKPELVSAVTTNARSNADASTPILKAEVVSVSPAAKGGDKEAEKVVLKIGQHQIETISAKNLSPELLKKGNQLEVKLLPGPELKIISQTPSPELSKQAATLENKLPTQAIQQLLLDRFPNTQSKDISSLIKQLAALIGQESSNPKATSNDSPLTSSTAYKTELPHTGSANLTASSTGTIQTAKAITTDSQLTQVKTWLQQLPQSQDISTATGLKNALSNTGIHAENQLKTLAQQNLSLLKAPATHTKANSSAKTNISANGIFQQLQSLHNKILQTDSKPSQNTEANANSSNSQTGSTKLSDIVNKTAQALSNSSHQVLSKLAKTSLSPLNTANASNSKTSPSLSTSTNSSISSTAQGPHQTHPKASSLVSSPGDNSALIKAGQQLNQAQTLSSSSWQNPLLTSQHASLESLLNDPLLQTPSHNNKLALGQILAVQTPQDTQPKVPLNWPEAQSEGALLKTLRTLFGHIEREQLQQLSDGQQGAGLSSSNPVTSQTVNHQWLPLLINHQQQLQLIEFYIDKQERQDKQGQKKQLWFINLHFDLPKLGEMGIEISLFENECSTTFWSQNRSSLSSIAQQVQPLRQSLTEQGIVVNELQSRFGLLEKRKRNIQQRLIDIST